MDLHRASGQAEGIIKYELPRYGSAREGGGANGRETDVMLVSLGFIIIFLLKEGLVLCYTHCY